jgi:two-component system, OmpR family, phosphate regulon response regulator PhoB
MSTQLNIMKILVVEDEGDIRDLMTLHLSRDGHKPDAAADGEEALKKLQDNTYDLVVLDWMLPGMSGIDIAKTLRKMSSRVPILMVTARVEPADIVLGLEAGADDYITKPFEVPVFLARIRALLRRASMAGEAPATPGLIEMGELQVNENSYEVKCAGAPVSLTPSEFKLLVALVKNQGRVLTRASLIDLVQGSDVSVVDRTIDTHVFGLRKKLGVCGDMIETVRGVGYRVKNS